MALGTVEFVQALVNGLLQGGFFALSAAGFSLIFGVQKVLNVAHGAFIVLAAFATIQFSILVTPVLHIDPLLSIFTDSLMLALVGGSVYLLLIYRIERTGFEAPLLATFGLSILLEYLASNGIGPFPALDPSHGIGAQAQHQSYSSTAFQIGPFFLQEAQALAFVMAVVVLPILQLFLSRTYRGRAIRATSQDWEAAEFSGINTKAVRLLSFITGSALAGLAGGLFAFTNSVTATAGDEVLLPVILVVVILGGIGSILGTLAAGFLVGVIMSVSSLIALTLPSQFQFHADLASLLTFLIFIVILMVRPRGLFGHGIAE